jgi:hypothetical protein
MLIAKKDNKVYDIEEVDKKRYLEDGYDIYKDGKISEYSPKKTISYNEYVKVKTELEELKASASNEELTKQVEELTKVNAELTKQVKDLTKANADLTKQVEKANAKQE